MLTTMFAFVFICKKLCKYNTKLCLHLHLHFKCATMFLYVISHVTWHPHEHPIDENKGHLIWTLYFHLSEGGYMVAFEWTPICFIKWINLGHRDR